MKIPKMVNTLVTQDDYTHVLQSLGYRRLGSGCFAEVFGKPKSNTVIKIGMINERDAYLDYLRAIKPSNPHFPKIVSIQCFDVTGTHESYFVVEMERLIPFYRVSARDKRLNRLGIIMEYGEVQFKNEEYNQSHNVRQVSSVINKLCKTHHYDGHTGNVMWRRRGRGYQLVVTDPVS